MGNLVLSSVSEFTIKINSSSIRVKLPSISPSFYTPRSQKRKKRQSNQAYFWAFACVKAACVNTMMKLIPGRHRSVKQIFEVHCLFVGQSYYFVKYGLKNFDFAKQNTCFFDSVILAYLADLLPKCHGVEIL